MAYVRKTMTLVESVQSRIQTMRHEELRTAKSSNNVTPVDDSYAPLQKLAVERMWKKAPELQATMPKEWCVKADRLTCRFEIGETRFNVDLDAVRGDEHILPPGSNDWRNTVVIEEHLITSEVRAFVDSRAVIDANRKDIESRFDVIRIQLGKFMDKHASLNKMLLDMPEFALYVEDSYIRKVNEKVYRTSTTKATAVDTEEEMSIDVEAIAAAAISYRITKNS